MSRHKYSPLSIPFLKDKKPKMTHTFYFESSANFRDQSSRDSFSVRFARKA